MNIRITKKWKKIRLAAICDVLQRTNAAVAVPASELFFANGSQLTIVNLRIYVI